MQKAGWATSRRTRSDGLGVEALNLGRGRAMKTNIFEIGGDSRGRKVGFRPRKLKQHKHAQNCFAG